MSGLGHGREGRAGPGMAQANRSRKLAPGIRPEEAARTTTPPFSLVSFDVLLSEDQGGLGFCPLPSLTGLFTGEVPAAFFLSGSLPSVVKGLGQVYLGVFTPLTVQAKTALSKVCPTPPNTGVSLLVSSV